MISTILLLPSEQYRKALLGEPEYRMDVEAWGDARPPAVRSTANPSGGQDV